MEDYSSQGKTHEKTGYVAQAHWLLSWQTTISWYRQYREYICIVHSVELKEIMPLHPSVWRLGKLFSFADTLLWVAVWHDYAALWGRLSRIIPSTVPYLSNFLSPGSSCRDFSTPSFPSAYPVPYGIFLCPKVWWKEIFPHYCVLRHTFLTNAPPRGTPFIHARKKWL